MMAEMKRGEFDFCVRPYVHFVSSVSAFKSTYGVSSGLSFFIPSGSCLNTIVSMKAEFEENRKHKTIPVIVARVFRRKLQLLIHLKRNN
jgi:hypothetical protein